MPPLCEKIQRIFGKRAAAPLKSRLAMVRVVSVAYSMVPAETPGTVLPQHAGTSGVEG